MKVEIPQKEEEMIEVLSRVAGRIRDYSESTGKSEDRTHGGKNGRDNQNMQATESASTSEQRLWRHCL